MNRPVHFRAWDGKKMHRVGVIHWPFRSDDPSMIRAEGRPYDSRGDWPVIENPILMQYTGLKDKDGTEIFEGDVLLMDDDGYFPQEYNEAEDEFEPIGHYEVYFSEGGACFWIRGVGKTETPELEYSPWNLANYKVVGNIYENPELTGGKDG